MRRVASFLLLTAVASGCVGGPETSGQPTPHYGRSMGPPSVPGVQGPYGQKIPMIEPYTSAPPGNLWAAQQMMSRSIPLSAVQMNGGACGPNGCSHPGMTPPGGALPPIPIPGNGMLSPPGVPPLPGMPAGPNVSGPGMLPPGMPGMPGMPGVMPTAGLGPLKGPMPGGTMPGPSGVINANIPPGMIPPGGLAQAQQLLPPNANSAASGIRFPVQRTQVRFLRPSGMRVSWFTQGPDGKPAFSTTPLETPARYNFAQAAIYRLRLSNIEGRPGLEVYPTMEVVPSNPKTEAFLSHSSVPVEFTTEDFKQIADGNYVVKVIYLPDPQYQDVAGTGTDEILSTRLEPGADPIQEALRRGSILLVIRMGNVDQEAPNTPPLNAPATNAAPPMMPPFTPGMYPFQVPYLGAKPGAITPPLPGMMPPNMPNANVPNPNANPNATNPAAPMIPAMPGAGATGPGGLVPGLTTSTPKPNPLTVPSVPLPPNVPAPSPEETPKVDVPKVEAQKVETPPAAKSAVEAFPKTTTPILPPPLPKDAAPEDKGSLAIPPIPDFKPAPVPAPTPKASDAPPAMTPPPLPPIPSTSQTPTTPATPFSTAAPTPMMPTPPPAPLVPPVTPAPTTPAPSATTAPDLPPPIPAFPTTPGNVAPPKN